LSIKPIINLESVPDLGIAGLKDNLYDEDDSESGTGWISWFCDLEGHEFFVEVDEDYIRDNFNLHGLREKITYFNEAMQMILDTESPDSDDLNDQNFLETY
jgi:casein kinase II subunit beta